MSKKKKRRWPLWVLAVAGLATLGWGLGPGNWFRAEEATALQGAPVRRGPLRISVVQRGNLEAKNAAKVKSELEGQATILSLVAEGTYVKEGDLLIVLDDSNLRDRRDAQQITVHNAEAEYTKAQQQVQIQESQNASDIAAGEQRVAFAETDLTKYIEGDWPRQLQEAEESIVLAEEEKVSAKDRLDWSRNLSEKGFVTRTELERDELAFNRSEILLEQAKRAKELLIRYDNPKEEARLRADLEEARRELERIKLQARARLEDDVTALRTTEARYRLENDKLEKLDEQIAKARIVSPAEGFVVYARDDSSRWGGGEPVQEGKSVREREELITIPSDAGMIAQASIHETVLKQVQPGQSCIVKIDALPDREFHGRVEYVALLPDKSSWWANPNQRLYKTEIAVLDANEEVRPGMSCGIEILVEELADALYVPVQAVFVDGGETICFKNTDGEPEPVSVETGLSNDKWVEIRAGLQEGEHVLLSPPGNFKPKPAPQQEREGGPSPGATPAEAGAPSGTAGRPGGAADSVEKARAGGGRPEGGARGRPEGAAGGRPAGAAGGEPESAAGGRPGAAAGADSSDAQARGGGSRDGLSSSQELPPEGAKQGGESPAAGATSREAGEN